ncbi:MAG: RusA family crossover junction endodeoxyribonuclease, partial [Dehalococcoidia bacterium]
MKEGKITIMGEPIPKGSTKSFYIKNLNRVVTTNANANTDAWESFIRLNAQEYLKARPGLFFGKGEALEIKATFHLSKPRSTPKKVLFPVTRPDLDKLERCVGDALNKVLYADDSQIVKWAVEKKYAIGPSMV